MKFSVLLSIYAKESPQFFRQAMDSILCQTKKPDEIVLVKDGPLTAELENEIEYYESSVPILKVVPLPALVSKEMFPLKCARIVEYDINKPNPVPFFPFVVIISLNSFFLTLSGRPQP